MCKTVFLMFGKRDCIKCIAELPGLQIILKNTWLHEKVIRVKGDSMNTWTLPSECRHGMIQETQPGFNIPGYSGQIRSVSVHHLWRDPEVQTVLCFPCRLSPHTNFPFCWNTHCVCNHRHVTWSPRLSVLLFLIILGSILTCIRSVIT